MPSLPRVSTRGVRAQRSSGTVELDTRSQHTLRLPPMATRADLRALQERFAESDPELLAAVDDVDLTLIDSWLRLTPWERAARCFDMAEGIAELKTWRRVG